MSLESESFCYMGRILEDPSGEFAYDALCSLNEREVFPEELMGFSKKILQRGVRFGNQGQQAIDLCGTGGDGFDTFNISTTASIIASAAGARVAKYGNFGISSLSGSSNVLQALGYNLSADPWRALQQLEDSGFCYLHAPSFYPFLGQLRDVRRRVGKRTVFNLLGPLCNPMKPSRRLLGTNDASTLEPLCYALRGLGVYRGLVVHGVGLDEITPTGETTAFELQKDSIHQRTFSPGDFGVDQASIRDLQGGNPEENAFILQKIARGFEEGPRLDASCMNAGAALYLCGISPSLGKGFTIAKKTVESKACLRKLEEILE